MRSLQHILIALAIFLAGAASAQERPALAEIAARQTYALHKLGGMTQLKINSQACYETITDKFLCIYLDTAAQQMDWAVADRLKLPRHEYFEDEPFLDRAGPVVFQAGMSAPEANAFFRRSYQQVERALARQGREPEA